VRTLSSLYQIHRNGKIRVTFGASPETRILDAGCGIGRMEPDFAEILNWDTTAIESDADYFHETKQVHSFSFEVQRRLLTCPCPSGCYTNQGAQA
jgi:2-polyprenyl-3-methyl-5-hydroxy-6-metoxy-1,4-benzoquinol methylase